jgi:hypothetical protein
MKKSSGMSEMMMKFAEQFVLFGNVGIWFPAGTQVIENHYTLFSTFF